VQAISYQTMADAARKLEEKAEDKAEHPTESDQEHSSTAKQPTSLVLPKEISTDIPAEIGPKDHHNELDSLSKSPAASTSTSTLKPPDPTRSSKSDEGVLVKVKSAVWESFKRQGSISSPTSLPPKRAGSSEKPEAKPTTGGETKVERDHSPAAAVKESQASTVKDAGPKSKVCLCTLLPHPSTLITRSLCSRRLLPMTLLSLDSPKGRFPLISSPFTTLGNPQTKRGLVDTGLSQSRRRINFQQKQPNLARGRRSRALLPKGASHRSLNQTRTRTMARI
jgi:hypothetical protein